MLATHNLQPHKARGLETANGDTKRYLFQALLVRHLEKLCICWAGTQAQVNVPVSKACLTQTPSPTVNCWFFLDPYDKVNNL